EHRGCNEQARHHRCNSEHLSRTHLLKNRGADEPAHHSAEPIIGDISSCNFLRYISDLSLPEVINQEAANRDLSSDVHEYSDGPQKQMAIVPDAACMDVVKRRGFGIGDHRQSEFRDDQGKYDECDSKQKIRSLYRGGFMHTLR